MVSSDSFSGGLALLWKPSTQVHVKNFSGWYIDAHIVCDSTGAKWMLTEFYGHPNTSKWEETWALLESLGAQILYSGGAWGTSMRYLAKRKRPEDA